jgi:hypothetical protein
VLKISQQKFIGLTRSDKNNEMYWKFRGFYEGETGNTPAPVPQQTPPLEPTTEPVKFPSSEESEQVKKFREKYGEFSEKHGTPSNPEKPTGS